MLLRSRPTHPSNTTLKLTIKPSLPSTSLSTLPPLSEPPADQPTSLPTHTPFPPTPTLLPPSTPTPNTGRRRLDPTETHTLPSVKVRKRLTSRVAGAAVAFVDVDVGGQEGFGPSPGPDEEVLGAELEVEPERSEVYRIKLGLEETQPMKTKNLKSNPSNLKPSKPTLNSNSTKPK
ncbi:hypothetical protein FB446DRAFT_793200 [Lentinula raphanica]|nr:hypothetical protein FB446DRAFT_793200 [Lentinula raphanica]